MPFKLPISAEPADYDTNFNSSVWQQAAEIICTRHRLSYSELRRSPIGENIIFFVDDSLVIKIYAPVRDQYRREKAALEFTAAASLSIETPQVRRSGELEGWKYLVVTQLSGLPMKEVWPELVAAEQLEIVSQLGVLIRELHSHAAPSNGPLNRDWYGFVERQAREAVERQRACNANPEWLRSLPEFLDASLESLPTTFEPVVLHGDVHLGNLLIRRTGGKWRITGLFDFADSFCGFREYEFISPGVLMVQGRRELQRAMLRSYGYEEADLDHGLRRRLMLLTVLYECSDLRKYALRLAPGAINLTLEELGSAIWRFA
jgi:hygromycin-B 7''-O-kinase